MCSYEIKSRLTYIPKWWNHPNKITPKQTKKQTHPHTHTHTHTHTPAHTHTHTSSFSTPKTPLKLGVPLHGWNPWHPKRQWQKKQKKTDLGRVSWAPGLEFQTWRDFNNKNTWGLCLETLQETANQKSGNLVPSRSQEDKSAERMLSYFCPSPTPLLSMDLARRLCGFSIPALKREVSKAISIHARYLNHGLSLQQNRDNFLKLQFSFDLANNQLQPGDVAQHTIFLCVAFGRAVHVDEGVLRQRSVLWSMAQTSSHQHPVILLPWPVFLA